MNDWMKLVEECTYLGCAVNEHLNCTSIWWRKKEKEG